MEQNTYEIWADFGPVGNTEKKIGANYEQLLRAVFSCFQGKKNRYTCFIKKNDFFFGKKYLG